MILMNFVDFLSVALHCMSGGVFPWRLIIGLESEVGDCGRISGSMSATRLPFDLESESLFTRNEWGEHRLGKSSTAAEYFFAQNSVGRIALRTRTLLGNQ